MFGGVCVPLGVGEFGRLLDGDDCWDGVVGLGVGGGAVRGGF